MLLFAKLVEIGSVEDKNVKSVRTEGWTGFLNIQKGFATVSPIGKGHGP